MNSTLNYLLVRYGPVLTIVQLAETLSRKPAGLRAALQESEACWVKTLNARKTRIGRRVYFPADVIAALIDGQANAEVGEK